MQDTLADLHIDDKPILTVLNKIDGIEGVTPDAIQNIPTEFGLPDDYIPVSAQQGWGLEELRARIEHTLAGQMTAITAHLPYSRSDLVALWRQNGVIEQESHEFDGISIVGKLPIQYLSQYSAYRTTESDVDGTR